MFGRTRMMSLATALAVLVLVFAASGALADETPECALLDDPQAIALISGAGETALRIQCGEISLLPTPLVPPEVEPSSEEYNILVNNRAIDTFPNITQSETSVAVFKNGSDIP
jgi:hypothetical protein